MYEFYQGGDLVVAFSQNGYLASQVPKDFGGLNNDYVPGTTVRLAPGVRADEVGDLLRYVAMRFHREVEPLMKVGCWGYAYRTVRAGSSLSNHASATAEDLNAPKHPLGARGTFTPAQVSAIRRILASCTDGQGPLIRWGGDYQGRADEMHFEAIGSLARIRAHMRFLTQPGSVVRPPITPDPPTVEDDDPMGMYRDREEFETRLRVNVRGTPITFARTGQTTDLEGALSWLDQVGTATLDYVKASARRDTAAVAQILARIDELQQSGPTTKEN